MTDSSSAYRPKIGSISSLAMSRPDERQHRDRNAEDDLAAHPLAEDPLGRPDDRPDVEAPALRDRAIERRHQRDTVLEQVGHPHRQDQVAEEQADEARRAGQDREQD